MYTLYWHSIIQEVPPHTIPCIHCIDTIVQEVPLYTMLCVYYIHTILNRRFHFSLYIVYTVFTLCCKGGSPIYSTLCSMYWQYIVQEVPLYTTPCVQCMDIYYTGGSTIHYTLCTLYWHYFVHKVSLYCTGGSTGWRLSWPMFTTGQRQRPARVRSNTVYSVWCTDVQCIVCSVQFAVCNVGRRVCGLQWAPYSVRCKLWGVHFEAYSLWRTIWGK